MEFEKNILQIPIIFISFLLFIPVVHAVDIGDLDVTPGSYDYGGVSIGSSKQKRFTIENTSATESFTIDTFNLTGSDDNQFEVIDDKNCEGKELSAKEECDIEVEFSPDDTGNMDATLEVSIDEDTDVLEVDLEGVGEESELNVDLSDESISFDDTYLGYESLEQLEISNTGAKLFTIEDVSLTGTDKADYEVDGSDCEDKTLAESDSCIVIILFQPETIGTKTANVRILVKDDNTDYDASLEADAITKEDGIFVTPVRKDFGEFEVGDKDSFKFIIENDLSTAYEITGVTLKGSNDFDIYRDECKNTELDDGTAGGDIEDRCDITINYDSNNTGFVVSNLEIKTNDPNNAKFLIPMWAYVNGAESYPSDIDGDTFETYIKRLIDGKIVSGYSDGTYKPDELVSRGQLAKFIFNAFDITQDKTCDEFPDVDLTDTFYTEIMSLKCAGIVTGFSDGTYKPEDPVTRGEVTKFITKALEKKGINVDLNKSENFSDVDDDDKFIIYIAYLSSIRFEGQNIINGYSDGEFKSLKFITRGEMSKMVDISMRYYDSNN